MVAGFAPESVQKAAGVARCWRARYRVLAKEISPSAVLARVLDDLVDICLRDEARTGTDVLRPIRRLEAVSLQAFLELRIRLQDLPDLRRVGRVFLLHDREHGDGDIALQIRLLIDCELDRAVLDAL